MILIVSTVVGLGVAAWNTWQRLGRSRRARAWSRSQRPDVPRHVLVMWPLFALACLLGPAVAVAPDGAPVSIAVVLLLLSLLTYLAYFMLPLPIPRFVQPRWYAAQQRETSRG